MLVIEYLLFAVSEKIASVLLTHSFVDVDVAGLFVMGRFTYLIMGSNFVHRVEVSGISQVGVVELL